MTSQLRRPITCSLTSDQQSCWRPPGEHHLRRVWVCLALPQVSTPPSTAGQYASHHRRSVLLAPPQVGTPRSTVVQYLSLYRRPCSTPQSKWTKGSMRSANSNKNYILFQWPVTSYGLKIVNKHRQIHR